VYVDLGTSGVGSGAALELVPYLDLNYLSAATATDNN